MQDATGSRQKIDVSALAFIDLDPVATVPVLTQSYLLLTLSYNRATHFMKVIAPPAKLYSLAAIAALLLFSSVTYAQAPKEPLNLLVLGDSISWGQGLRDEHKASYLVKRWLEQQTGREVRQQMQAHSGAVIGPSESSLDVAARDAALTLDGELSRAYPTINDQVDYAV